MDKEKREMKLACAERTGQGGIGHGLGGEGREEMGIEGEDG